jgi:hypothetical protein
MMPAAAETYFYQLLCILSYSPSPSCVFFSVSLSSSLFAQIGPDELLQSMSRLLQQEQEGGKQEGERLGEREGEGCSLLVKEVVTGTRVPVLKLLDTKSDLEVRLSTL